MPSSLLPMEIPLINVHFFFDPRSIDQPIDSQCQSTNRAAPCSRLPRSHHFSAADPPSTLAPASEGHGKLQGAWKFALACAFCSS